MSWHSLTQDILWRITWLALELTSKESQKVGSGKFLLLPTSCLDTKMQTCILTGVSIAKCSCLEQLWPANNSAEIGLYFHELVRNVQYLFIYLGQNYHTLICGVQENWDKEQRTKTPYGSKAFLKKQQVKHRKRGRELWVTSTVSPETYRDLILLGPDMVRPLGPSLDLTGSSPYLGPLLYHILSIPSTWLNTNICTVDISVMPNKLTEPDWEIRSWFKSLPIISPSPFSWSCLL